MAASMQETPGSAPCLPNLIPVERYYSFIPYLPTSPHCPCCAQIVGNLPAPVIEFMFETTRAVTNLLIAKVPQRFPGIRFIIPHGGAALSVLIDRIATGTTILPGMGDSSPDDSIYAMGSFFYDLAGSPVPRLLPALRTLAPEQRSRSTSFLRQNYVMMLLSY